MATTGIKFALAQTAPVVNVDAADATSRVRSTYDKVDFSVASPGADTDVPMGGAKIPKGARVLSGQITSDGNGNAAAAILLLVGSVQVAVGATQTAGTTPGNSTNLGLLDFVTTQDEVINIQVTADQTAGIVSVSVLYTID